MGFDKLKCWMLTLYLFIFIFNFFFKIHIYIFIYLFFFNTLLVNNCYLYLFFIFLLYIVCKQLFHTLTLNIVNYIYFFIIKKEDKLKLDIFIIHNTPPEPKCIWKRWAVYIYIYIIFDQNSHRYSDRAWYLHSSMMIASCSLFFSSLSYLFISRF